MNWGKMKKHHVEDQIHSSTYVDYVWEDKQADPMMKVWINAVSAVEMTDALAVMVLKEARKSVMHVMLVLIQMMRYGTTAPRLHLFLQMC
ncbi:hypothetical protein C0J52_15937 [Blattella germanica]|nr:hypothetical protein C0J52_15937 [Blattella germanica]